MTASVKPATHYHTYRQGLRRDIQRALREVDRETVVIMAGER